MIQKLEQLFYLWGWMVGALKLISQNSKCQGTANTKSIQVFGTQELEVQEAEFVHLYENPAII